MSSVETPPPAPAPTGRHCPRCGAAMTDEQEWCLRCGAAVGTRVVAAPGWRTPLALVAALLALAAVAVAVAIVQLADDTDQVAQAPQPAATPAPPAATPTPALPEVSGGAPTPTPTPTPSPTATPSPAPTATPGGSSRIARWPAGKSGWTVILASDTSRAQARRKARAFSADGVSGVGVLDSDGFSSLKGGYWVVFAGQYDSRSAASDALDGLDVQDAYVRRVTPG